MKSRVETAKGKIHVLFVLKLINQPVNWYCYRDTQNTKHLLQIGSCSKTAKGTEKINEAH